MSRLLTTEEVINILNVPKSWIYQQIHYRNLPFPYYKVGKHLRFREEDIHAYLKRQKVEHSTMRPRPVA